jgi:diguanylate cyclase (GGDEF)-like protein
LFSTVAVSQEDVDVKQFIQVAEQVDQLIKSDLVLALKKLTAYKDLLNILTIEQNLLYFKLLTEIQIEQNKYTKARKTSSKGLSIAKRLASPSILISELLYLRGFAFENLGDISQATKEYKKGLEVAESLHNKVQVAAGLINLGAIAYLTDDFKRSLMLLNDAYNIASQTDDEELKGTVNTELGIIYSYLLQDEQSMAYYKQSYLHFKKAGMLLAAHISLNNIAITHTFNKDFQQAIDVFKTIISESNKDSPSDSMYRVYSGMAWAHLSKEDSNPDAAYEYFLMAKQYLQFTEKSDFKLQYYMDEATVLYQLERFDEVLTSIAEVEKIIIKHQDGSLIKKYNSINLVELKAAVFNKQGQHQLAYKLQSQVLILTDELYEKRDRHSIEQMRLKLEGEQADKKNKILHNQKVLNETHLHEAKLANEEQYTYLIISALVALAFAWVLVKLIQSQHRLKIASSIDSMTGVANRRSIMKAASEVFELSKNKKTDLSLLLIDIDHFKIINERLGHSSGDKVLAQIAELTASMMRKNDILGRFGGEEFMVCLPKTSLISALEIAERIRFCINEYSWPSDTLDTINVSIGVVCLTDERDFTSLIKRVDEQLYQAKSSGRNKVCG